MRVQWSLRTLVVVLSATALGIGAFRGLWLQPLRQRSHAMGVPGARARISDRRSAAPSMPYVWPPQAHETPAEAKGETWGHVKTLLAGGDAYKLNLLAITF